MTARVDRARKPYSRPASRPTADDGAWLHDKAPGTGRRPNTKNGLSALVGNGTPSSNEPNAKLMVSNLHYEITATDLTKIFAQVGTLVKEPRIKYDRSGRSSGVAYVAFETPAEATRALKQYKGVLAKGQPMEIAFDNTPAPRRVASAPSSLLHRIEKAPLLDRLDGASTANAGNGKSRAKPTSSVGPIRTRGPQGKRGEKKGGEAQGKEKMKPKTAEELDEELDTFMGDSAPTSAPDAAAGGAPATVAAAEGDVDMA